MAEEWSVQVRRGNFASLTDHALFEKSWPAYRVMPDPVDVPIPAQSTAQSTVHVAPANPVNVQLSANEYKAMCLVAEKKRTTPQHLLRNVVRKSLIEFVEQGEYSRA